ncbi:MAG: zinc ribbon domain-containing protein [Clostridia bacterium]|nr:zinc ribbon domain-containing protein [Clostridia bacterium]MBR5365269.1 zinc ribbon domain-containing protein [Clostridia bacterium]
MNMNHPFAGFPSIEEYIKERNAPGISLAEAKTLAIPHGPLCRVEYASSRSGMAINDFDEDRYILSRTDAGAALIHRKTVGSMQRTITEKQYRVGEESASEIRALVERENLIAWSKMKVDPDHPDARFQPVDTTWSSSLKLTFETPDGEGEMTAAISMEAAKQQGDRDVISALIDLLRGCIRDDALLSEKTERSEGSPNAMGFLRFPEPNDAPASKGLMCPVCGSPERPGNFCPECGAPKKWICPACGTENKRRFCTECGQKRP